MRRRHAWLAAALVIAGCGRLRFDELDGDGGTGLPIAEPPRFAAGTRLQPITYAGTPPVLAGWYDRELDIECILRDAKDGALRCQPTYQNTFSYRDPGCTMAVVEFAGPYQLPCGLTPRVGFDVIGQAAYELGPQYTGQVYAGTPGNCTVSNTTNVMFERGAAIPDSRFVGFTSTIISGSQRLGYVQLVGDDGSQQRNMRTLFDTQLGVRCAIQETDVGQARCLPTEDLVPGVIYYRDATCTQPVVSLPSEASYVQTRIDNLCTYNTRFWERGAPYTGPVYTFSGSCTLATAPPLLYELGPELSIDANVSLAMSREPFDARLEHLAWRTPDGIVTPVPFDDFYDTARGQRCRAQVEELTSQLICAPSWNGYGVSYWQDSSCSGTAKVGRPMCRTESAAIYYGTTMPQTYTCDGYRYQVSAFETPLPTTVWERQLDGTCESRVEDLYTVTRTIDGSELQPMSRVRL